METDDDLSIGGDGPCPVCKKPIPKLTWRNIENIRLVCCGKLICHCLSEPITTEKNCNMTTTSALCDIDKCPLCNKPTVYTNSKEFHDRTMKHVLDGKAWAQKHFDLPPFVPNGDIRLPTFCWVVCTKKGMEYPNLNPKRYIGSRSRPKLEMPKEKINLLFITNNRVSTTCRSVGTGKLQSKIFRDLNYI
jgi:hypothetical protein